MKYLFFTLFLFCTTLQAQEIDTTETSTVEVVQEIYNQTEKAVVAIAQALKVPAEHVYTVMVKQQVVNSVTYLLIFIISLLLLFNSYKFWQKAKIEDEYDPQGTFVGFSAIVFLLIGITMLLISIILLDYIIMGLLNPEYGALKDIMNWLN